MFEHVHRGDNADQYAVVIDNEQAMHMQAEHVADYQVNRCVESDGEHRRRHDIGNRRCPLEVTGHIA